MLDIWSNGLYLGWVPARDGGRAECRVGTQGRNKLIELSRYEEGEAWGPPEVLV